MRSEIKRITFDRGDFVRIRGDGAKYVVVSESNDDVVHLAELGTQFPKKALASELELVV